MPVFVPVAVHFRIEFDLFRLVVARHRLGEVEELEVVRRAKPAHHLVEKKNRTLGGGPCVNVSPGRGHHEDDAFSPVFVGDAFDDVLDRALDRGSVFADGGQFDVRRVGALSPERGQGVLEFQVEYDITDESALFDQSSFPAVLREGRVRHRGDLFDDTVADAHRHLVGVNGVELVDAFEKVVVNDVEDEHVGVKASPRVAAYVEVFGERGARHA